MAAPVLMTLFTDDAVEVRYTDQSCLQLSPCGSTFVHHESPGQLVHPAHGMKTITQRCEFVTSDYREKVTQALDFRNRFAERPFLCQALIEQDQIMALYAKISSTAWPKGLEQANFEYMNDGGVRLISEDEYASLILSPHRQDFTVCYLCGVSQDKKRNPGKSNAVQNTKLSQHSKQRQEKIETKVDRVGKFMANQIDLLVKSKYTDGMSDSEKSREELNISPISFASTQISRETSPVEDSKTERKRYSTPTNVVHNAQNSHGELESIDGSFLQFVNQGKSDKNTLKTEIESTCIANTSNISKHSSDSDESVTQKHVHWLSTDSGGTDCSQAESLDGASNSQRLYSWVTRHFSCEECPVSWNHVLNMARAAVDNREELEKFSSATSVHISQKPKGVPKKINPEKYCMAPLPESLPMTCPGQHLHRQYGKYVHDDERDLVENLTSLSKGKLKIILIDGIIFRVVRMAATKFVEIYPGDGSVIVSQGLGGHFYRHLIPVEQRIEERTYSIKALPPTTKNAPYSIEKLVKRASRFLLQSSQEDKSFTDKIACCWKYKDTTVIEPLPATQLEECSVPGHGRFSAFSNGHVRIVFEDRTSLDMGCDFTQRLVSCLEHCDDEKEKLTLQQQLDQHTQVETRSKQGLCKLLLPNGQYQIVDSSQPGVYKKYTDAAIEWAAWVNSSPNQRKIFYQNWNKPDDATLMVTKELQKIKCFNYLSESTLSNSSASSINNTNILHSQPDTWNSNAHNPYDSTLNRVHNYSKQTCHSTMQSNNIFGQSDLHYISGQNSQRLTLPHHGSFVGNPTKELEMFRGFNSVREALLKTSSAIKDIDEILDKRGSKP